MRIIKTIKEMQALRTELRSDGKSVGFVPTMGALHDGHLSLVTKSVEDNDITIVSIFVNPTQFGPGEDFNRYPKDHKGDIEKISTLNVETVFLPEIAEIYPKDFSTFIYVGGIGNILCGASRPDHFNGVGTVVTKLFNIITPDRAYFGQKDFQQTVVIKKLVKELGFNVEIVVCPIVRESDGLAMSSRNVYLSKEERNSALIIYKALQHAEDLILSEGMNDSDSVKGEIEKLIKSEPLAKIAYIEIVDPRNLKSLTVINESAIICIAVSFGSTRLIDNLILNRQ